MRLNHPQGAAAEETAWRFLQQQGCRLRARNWHCPFGEIDLIVEHQATLVFVEVRYRQSQAYGGAAHSIGATKLGRLQRSAEYYIQQHRINGGLNCHLTGVGLMNRNLFSYFEPIKILLQNF